MGKSELLIYGLLLAGFLLFNYVLQRAVRRARQQQELEQAQQPAPVPEDEVIGETWGRRPQADLRRSASAEPARRLEVMAPGVAPPRRWRRSSNALFRSRKDLRHAVVVMTVLGPCRALEPYDRPPPGRDAGGGSPGPA